MKPGTKADGCIAIYSANSCTGCAYEDDLEGCMLHDCRTDEGEALIWVKLEDCNEALASTSDTFIV